MTDRPDISEGSTGQPDESDDPTAAGPAVVPKSAADTPLQSLTPTYVEDHHGTYVRRLEAAVKDPRNLNIAITGRYGAGKSSVLDQFETNHHRSVQRLAISTLAPGEGGQTTTNEIQKEIVKQLLYGASSKVGKSSRFNAIAVLTWPKALFRASLIALIIGGSLVLLNVVPDLKWTTPDDPRAVRVGIWITVAAVAIAAIGAFLRATHGRFNITNVSAAGASLAVATRPQTPFDEYTDEIVHYFDRESKDIVVFEDLDRFENPGIFETLRELNLLLNNTPPRRAKRRGNRAGRAIRWLLDHVLADAPVLLSDRVAARLPFPWATRLLGLGVPLRFVYAVKDSVFERIDAQTANSASLKGQPVADPSLPPASERALVLDTAQTETQRANRTKFFDIVIPIVPFISHRNARELLVDILSDAQITGIDRRLLNLVAQHCTDMRLLRNMCNEYLLFAERLLESPKTAPDLNQSHLFALVAYKNFHLSDFENISRGSSDLDRLYDFHQLVVRESIAHCERETRRQRSAPTRTAQRNQTVQQL